MWFSRNDENTINNFSLFRVKLTEFSLKKKSKNQRWMIFFSEEATKYTFDWIRANSFQMFYYHRTPWAGSIMLFNVLCRWADFKSELPKEMKNKNTTNELPSVICLSTVNNRHELSINKSNCYSIRKNNESEWFFGISLRKAINITSWRCNSRSVVCLFLFSAGLQIVEMHTTV